MSRFSRIATATTVSLVGSLLLVPGAVAADHTVSTNIPLTCKATPNKFADPQDFSTGDDGVSVDITTPDTVGVGEDFTVRLAIRPVQINVGGLSFGAKIENVSRIKLDVAIPEGLTYLDSSLDNSAANLDGFTVKRINESGNDDPNGGLLRITSTDNATVGNGPNTSGTTAGGVTHVVRNDKLNMKFPVVELKFRAESLGAAALGVRTAGNAGNYGADENFLTMLAKITAPFVGTLWAPTQCTPRADKDAPLAQQASALATVRVVDSGPATETGLIVTAADATAGVPSAITAQVSPVEATGTVAFTSGDTTVKATVKNGSAAAELIFPSVGTHELHTTFTPDKAYLFTPSTSTTQVQVKGQDALFVVAAPGTARANSMLAVRATTNAAATGTVTFRLGDGDPIVVPVKNGRTSASLTVPSAPGQSELTATFTPAEGSLFAGAEERTTITVSSSTSTVLTLEGPQNTVRPGEEVTVRAELQPTADSTVADGTVVFSTDGKTVTVPVSDNSAAFTFVPDREGSFSISAKYTPVDASQTPATADITVTAASTSTSLALNVPEQVLPFEAATFGVTVSPAADGTLTATHGGRSTTVPVTAGTAVLPMTFARSGAQQVTLSFVPAGDSPARATTRSFDVEVTAVTFESATVAIAAESSVTAGTPLPLAITVNPDQGTTRAVSGSLSFFVDGEPLVGTDGESVTMPVSGGQAAVNLTFAHGGERTVTVTFTGDNGVTASGTHTVTVTGGKQAPGGSSDIGISSGTHTDSAGTNPFASLLALLTPLWTWLNNIFTKFLGGSS
ncbi:Ig-like domain-containing protein [Corynebacterium sp. CCM 9185]|uniref:Ig-like domain repeat protein n=1 Tax=Corynebacterium marambiense TaxID=2765364 RepID=A0ABS0VY61_9CORY|nr:Ig-like domain-containing protein [Corynebacterium marambiense]MBI9001717.1 Ig-like domain repeat protein [Corynebacterium marambiense]MCK7662181.1 Ig-like domain-containing protein [Corynebacterium marambiense]